MIVATALPDNQRTPEQGLADAVPWEHRTPTRTRINVR